MAEPATTFESIELRGVSQVFKSMGAQVPALDNIDLTIRRNEFVTVLGPSGSGKTTLFNLLAGLLQPTSGQVLVNGQPLQGINDHVAYMFQQPALLDWRDVLGNVLIGQEFLDRPMDQARAEALEGLAEFGLAGCESRRPWELSGGMRQRVALLRTYLTRRDLLLLDEPFGALDALTRLQMQQFLLDQWERDQRTVVFITHDVEEALLLGGRVLVMAPRPTHVRATVELGFERPRNAEELLADSDFVELKHQLLAMLSEPAQGHPEGEGA